MGIFLCDGDCEALRPGSSNVTTFSLEEVIRDFFRQNSTISFVAVITIIEDSRQVSAAQCSLNIRHFMNPKPRYKVSDGLALALAGFGGLPSPIATPANALVLTEN
jgi:hypothetical protein